MDHNSMHWFSRSCCTSVQKAPIRKVQLGWTQPTTSCSPPRVPRQDLAQDGIGRSSNKRRPDRCQEGFIVGCSINKRHGMALKVLSHQGSYLPRSAWEILPMRAFHPICNYPRLLSFHSVPYLLERSDLIKKVARKLPTTSPTRGINAILLGKIIRARLLGSDFFSIPRFPLSFWT